MKCAFIIYPIVEFALPEDLLRAWQRSPYLNRLFFDNQANVASSSRSDSAKPYNGLVPRATNALFKK